ncbi:MAG TPA: type II secretion system protein M [Steroidobacteraceae bacterium]|jgi:general secretion pathway protein M|nr:type II secretion system protein M [Steroidobacteraceae bacterium]
MSKLSLNGLSFEALTEWLGQLSERERRMVVAGAVLVPLLLVFGVLLPLDHSVAQAHARLLKKRTDLEWMQGVAPELAASPQPPSAAGESLLVIVDRSARESGLSGALSGSEPAGPGALSLRLQKAPFDVLVVWLARLAQQNGIRVDSATIDSAGAPGLVNAAVVLHSG